MWSDLLWLLCVGWTLLATAAVLRADTIKHTAKLAFHATLRTCQLWKRPAVLEEEDEEEAVQAQEDEAPAPPPPAPSPYAASQVRVWRYVVTPRRAAPTTHHQHRRPPLHSHHATASSSSAAAAPARPAPLDFAVELQWKAPPAVLEGPRMPITYELRLQPEESVAKPAASDAAPAQQEKKQREEESNVPAAPAPLIHRFTMSAPPVAEPVTTAAAMDLDGAEAEESHDSGSGENSASEMKESDEQKKMYREPRKRKVASRSSSRTAPSAALVKRNNRTRSGDAEAAAAAVALSFDEDDESPNDALAAMSSSSATAVAAAAPASAQFDLHEPALQRSAAPAPAAAAAPAVVDSNMRGTFEEPGFLLEHPGGVGASGYTVRVLASAGSYASAAASAPRPPHADCMSLPVTMSFAPLPSLLYLVQSVPLSGGGNSHGHARKVLDAFDKILESLTPRDVLEGIDWATPLLHMIKPTHHHGKRGGSGGNNKHQRHIHKRTCNVLGKLVEWKCILLDLCSNAALVRALRQLVDHRLQILAQRTHEERAKKRAKKDDTTTANNAAPSATATPTKQSQPDSAQQFQPSTPLAVSEDESPLAGLLVPDELPAAAPAENEGDSNDEIDDDDEDDESVAPAATPDANAAAAAAASSPAISDAILENVLWFALAAVRLHDDHPCAPCRSGGGAASTSSSSSSSSSPSPSLVSLRSFVSAGGHLLLFNLAQQCSKASWFGQYQADVLTALANLCVCSCCGVAAVDSASLLFFLLHQATFGSAEAQLTLRHSNVRHKIANPFDN